MRPHAMIARRNPRQRYAELEMRPPGGNWEIVEARDLCALPDVLLFHALRDGLDALRGSVLRARALPGWGLGIDAIAGDDRLVFFSVGAPMVSSEEVLEGYAFEAGAIAELPGAGFRGADMLKRYTRAAVEELGREFFDELVAAGQEDPDRWDEFQLDIAEVDYWDRVLDEDERAPAYARRLRPHLRAIARRYTRPLRAVLPHLRTAWRRRCQQPMLGASRHEAVVRGRVPLELAAYEFRRWLT